MKLKVCGMKESDNIHALAQLRPDMMGFIFYAPSPRYALPYLDAEMLSKLPPDIQKVGVFVNSEYGDIISICDRFQFYTVQLHGAEPPDLCMRIKDAGFTVIKVFPVSDRLPDHMAQYKGCCDLFLFDTKSDKHGGTGQKFDWDVLSAYDNEVPLILSGGIGPESVADIKALKGLNIYGVDINSRFEERPGVKNIRLVSDFKDTLMICDTQ